jgi:hypothetical protein
VKEIPFLKQHGGSAKSVVISRFDDDDYWNIEANCIKLCVEIGHRWTHKFLYTFFLCEIWGCHEDEYEVYSFQGYNV